jgi:hypothetical protein
VESLRKGLSGMDAARAAMGQGWPFVGGRLGRASGAMMERRESRAARPGCRVCFLFGYFLFAPGGDP